MRTLLRSFLPPVSFFALALLAVGPAAAQKPATSTAITSAVRQPLRFELLDRGLLARGSGYAMMLRPGSAAVSVGGTGAILRMTWPGADQRVQPAGDEPAAGTTNYLIGNDPSRWRRGVQSFRTARYRGLYPAIDLVFYGNEERLEYDFIVAPGIDVKSARPIVVRDRGTRTSPDTPRRQTFRPARVSMARHAPSARPTATTSSSPRSARPASASTPRTSAAAATRTTAGTALRSTPPATPM